jgi:RNA polymerase sigma-70 factor, ECF subfamily
MGNARPESDSQLPGSSKNPPESPAGEPAAPQPWRSSGPELPTPETTLTLFEQMKGGDATAIDRLFGRNIPPLRRWAHGKLPPAARGMQDTLDLVQDALTSAVRRLKGFDVRHQGAFQAYLRLAVTNRIRDLIRQSKRRPQAELPEDLPDARPSPLYQAMRAEDRERYQEALQRLRPEDREAIVGRVELQYSYDELMLVLNKKTVAATRMTVTRAMKRLASELEQVSGGNPRGQTVADGVGE